MYVGYTGERRTVDELFALTGKMTDRAYLQRVAEKLLKNAAEIEKSDKFRDRAAVLREMADMILKEETQ